MSTEHRSFEEYWAGFVLRHCASSRGRLQVARVGMSLTRSAFGRGAPEKWRWAIAAALRAPGQLLSGTLDEEVERVTRVDEEGWRRPDAPTLRLSDSVSSSRLELEPQQDPLDRAWAVWM